MLGKNDRATIYLIEDINDVKYVGSTSEKRFQDRLYTHRRDKKDCKNNCSSMKLNLSYCMIVALKEINNTKEERDFWESHYINNVYPECVNIDRFERTLPREYKRDYYLKNRERIIERVTKYRKENSEKVNATRREWYQKNKERILEERRLERLANL